MKKIEKIFIGPVDIAGQAGILARAFRELGISAISLTYKRYSYDYQVDQCWNIQNKNKLLWPFIAVIQFIKSIFLYDFFLFIYGYSLLPWNLDLPILKLLGKKVGVLFCGDDIRDCELVLKEKPKYSVCNIKEHYEYSILTRKRRIRIVKYFQKYANFILSHPEYSQLLYKKYDYFWVPIDLKEYSLSLRKNKTPIIVHAPSNRAFKGTQYLIEIIKRLKEEGYIFEFVLLENLPNKEIKKRLQSCDIVVDQLLNGWHGKFSVEAMACGKPVLCYIRDDFRKYSPELPILSTSPDNLYKNLKFLIENPNERLQLGKKGREYVEKYHDSIKIAKKLIEYYEE